MPEPQSRIRDLLDAHFPGAWGEDPSSTRGANVSILRSTNLDDDGHVDLSTGAARRFSARELAEKRLAGGDILLEASGGGPGKPVGRVALFRQEGEHAFASSNFFRTLRVNRRLADPAYVTWSLQRLQKRPEIWQFQQQTTGIINLRYADYLNSKIFTPSLAEQRRIAEILDSFDLAIFHLRSPSTKFTQLRTAHIRKLMDDGLSILRSVEASELSCVERKMHGRWTVAPLASTLDAIEAGNSPNVEDSPAGPGEWGVLKVSAIGRHGFRPEENKVAHDKSLHVKNLCVHPGDLLISRANTSELVGLTCVVRETPPGLMLCDKTLRLHVNPTRTSAEYVHLALSLTEIRRQIETAATGTSGSMKNISQAAIRRLMIPWADRELIDRVVRDDAAYVAQIEALMRQEQGLIRLKQGLMEDLLTGRVRVSEAEAVVESL
ncbi:restriction endonuclease subunit S [Streptosporangium sp. CA-115845]|uniref:restriction endonuclease subunit S n=1 Tax=Streptosporangium sp. CA-115845 TaxID=3240071 RepID=UPI003D92B105